MPERITFADENVQHILDGQKWITFRHGYLDEHDLGPGDQVALIRQHTGALFAKAEVHCIAIVTAEALARHEWDGHRQYDSVDELLEHLARYYTSEQLEPTTKLDAIWLKPDSIQKAHGQVIA